MMRILAAALVYFTSVFAVGFVLGVFRTLWFSPWLGERAAELAELPVMLFVIYVVAGKLHEKFEGLSTKQWLLAGVLALAAMVTTEFTVVLALRGMTLDTYLSSRDAVAFPAYLASLLVFAALPALVACSRERQDANVS